MRHRNAKKILDRKKGARTALLKLLAAQVLLYEKVKTTQAKAKAVRPLVERFITHSRTNTLVTRRYLTKHLPGQNVVNKCLEVLGPRYVDRKGGYTRIVSLGRRKGDAAQKAVIELI